MHRADDAEVGLVFDALGNRRRRAILALVAGEPQTSRQLAEGFDCSWPAISKHLKVLIEAKLIGRYDMEDNGRVYYVPSPLGVQVAQDWLADLA